MPRLVLAGLLPLLAACNSQINRPHGKLPAGVPPLARWHTQPPARLWTSFDGTQFPYSVWPSRPPRQPRGAVILLPGWDAVTGDYRPLARRLADEGYVVYGSENRAGIYDPVVARRGSAEHWHDWVDDTKAFVSFVRQRHPGAPLFIQGHSFGTILAIQAAAELVGADTPQGLILHSPAFPFMAKNPEPVTMTLLRCVSWFRAPHLRWMDRMRRGPTNDPLFNCVWMNSDDRVRQGYKIRFLVKAKELGRKARLSSRALQLPVLALGGGRDYVVVTSPEEQDAYRHYLQTELAGGHAEFIWYDDGCHTLTETPTRQRMLDDVVRWLERHTRR